MIRIPERNEFVHISIDGKSACSGTTLSQEYDSTSPEYRWAPVCKTCLDIQGHLAREKDHELA